MTSRVLLFVASVGLANVCTTGAFLVSDGLQRVNTKYGEIVGHIENIQFDGKSYQVAKFLGIPYAEPPVGDLRFRKPVPIRSFSAPFSAHSFGPACIQNDYVPVPGRTYSKDQEDSNAIPGVKYSEDCLYLNIFVPDNTGQSGILPKPVMVWIHGGGFIIGHAQTYEGNVLSAYTDVIVVTIHYRLGPVGFFSTHDEHARGNYGVWDQHMAIKWVRDNIHSFGGDRNNITIFGESAGSSSVVYQTMYAGNDGVFKRAIAESGSISAWAVTTKEANYNASLKFAVSLGCDFPTHEDILKCMRSKSVSEIKAAATNLQNITNNFSPPKWAPVNDGEFVTIDPIKMLDMASKTEMIAPFSVFRNKDLLIGANNYDGGVIVVMLYGLMDLDVNITMDDLKMKFIPELIPFVFQETASDVSVDAVLTEYRDYTGVTNAMESLLRMCTDATLNAPTVKTARAHSMGNQAQTYLYQFSTRPPPLRSLTLPSYLTGDPAVANHGDEVMYVFGFDPSMFQHYAHKFSVSKDVKPSDIRISKLIMTAWSNFARSGNPNLPTNLSTIADVLWKPFSNADQNYLEITPTMSQDSVKRQLAARGVAFWNELLPNLLDIGKKVSS